MNMEAQIRIVPSESLEKLKNRNFVYVTIINMLHPDFCRTVPAEHRI